MKIDCRARVSPNCYDGRDIAESIYVTPENYFSDSTFKNGSIVCDACYIAVGQPLLSELEERVSEARLVQELGL